MRKHTMSATQLPIQLSIQLLAGLWMAVALAGCMVDASTRARTDSSCYIGGCSAELCTDRPDMISPCIWRDAYVCFRDAMCERQPGGSCGWTPTRELTACLASHDPLPGSQP